MENCLDLPHAECNKLLEKICVTHLSRPTRKELLSIGDKLHHF